MWKLVTVPETKWRQDDSGYHSLINYIGEGVVRLDLMLHVQEPAISFQGQTDDVRKAAMQYIDENCICISAEHAAYIGAQLAKASLLGSEYEQD